MSVRSQSYVNGVKSEPFAVSVTDTTPILAVGNDGSGRLAVVFSNNSATDSVFGGPTANVTAATGMLIPAKTTFVDDYSQDAWYFITFTGKTVDLHVLKIIRPNS